MKHIIRLLQKLGLYPMPDDYPLPTIPLYPRKAVLNSMTVTIDGKDFSEYVKSVEIGYRNAPAEVVAEEQRKWEIGQEDTQPIPVIDALYAEEEGWNEKRDHEHVHWAIPDDPFNPDAWYGDDPITPGGTWPEELDCE